jgi:hypothetical protein
VESAWWLWGTLGIGHTDGHDRISLESTMTAHDDEPAAEDAARPSARDGRGRPGDNKPGWAGPGSADAARAGRHAPDDATVAGYDDGDSRVFLEGDG